MDDNKNPYENDETIKTKVKKINELKVSIIKI